MRVKEKFVLQWHLTHKCNLRCKHCYQDDYTSDMKLDDMENIIRQFSDFVKANNYRGHINFTGGEPLLKIEELRVLMNFCEENNISFGILTNGTMLTEEIAKELYGYQKLAFVQMSLEGGKKTNDSIRGKGTYDKVFKAVRILNKYNIETVISFTVHKGNYKELDKLVLACRIHGVKRFWTDRLVPSDNSLENKLLLLNTEEYREFVQKLYKHSKSRLGGTVVECKRSLQGLEYADCQGYKCSAANNLIAVLANGDVMLCRRLPIIAGSLKEETLDGLIDRSRDIRKELESNDNECKNCFMKRKCNNGARCLTYVLSGKFNGKDSNCWVN